MAEVTLRRHLAALVEAGLIVRRDSPNGKRYARRGPAGEPAAVFGFDLSPLVVQATAFDAEAEALRRQRRERQFVKERISLRRRDIQKWLTLALDENLPGDWEPLRRRFLALARPLRSLRSDEDPDRIGRACSRSPRRDRQAAGIVRECHKNSGNDDQTIGTRQIQKTKHHRY